MQGEPKSDGVRKCSQCGRGIGSRERCGERTDGTARCIDCALPLRDKREEREIHRSVEMNTDGDEFAPGALERMCDETRTRPFWFPHVNEMDHAAALAWKNAKGDTPHRAVVDAVTDLILSRVPAPASQDRTRAIVEAAEALESALTDDHGGEPTQAARIGEHAREQLDRLTEALALPAPEWTREPPKEPGLWWYRPLPASPPTLTQVDAHGRCEAVEWSGWNPVVSFSGGEWFPVPISPPPVSP